MLGSAPLLQWLCKISEQPCAVVLKEAAARLQGSILMVCWGYFCPCWAYRSGEANHRLKTLANVGPKGQRWKPRPSQAAFLHCLCLSVQQWGLSQRKGCGGFWKSWFPSDFLAVGKTPYLLSSSLLFGCFLIVCESLQEAKQGRMSLAGASPQFPLERCSSK